MNHLSLLTLRLAMLSVALSSIASGAEPLHLRAGSLTMVFDAENAALRYLRVGNHEVLRGITAPVRDENWATVAPQVSNVQVDDGGDHCRVTFDVRCAEGDIDFRWKGTITGSADNEVEFKFDGVAHSSFKRNRIGFCVLHGPSAAGQPWEIEAVDEKTTKGSFPRFISPHQPAKNLKAISHKVAEGINARVEFAGEVFEMEDQRNWTDASFKTYCTPLELPYPVAVPKGTTISQTIRVTVRGDLSKVSPDAEEVVLTVTNEEAPLPRLGLQISSEVDDLTDENIARLKALHLNHLRVDLALSEPSFVKKLSRAAQQAKALEVSLHVGIDLGDSPDFSPLITVLKKLQPSVSNWLVIGGDPEEFQIVQRKLSPLLGDAHLGVTHITNFVDLNRDRPRDESIKAIGFAINPQIHAFDNGSMIETLPIHADVVSSTRQFVPDRNLVIGPITLRPQWVRGEDPPGGPPAGPLPTYVDARQVTWFAAAWTLGSIKYLADARADSATYYETVGWNGIIDADDVAARPKGFPSRPGEAFPIYDVLREIGEFAGGKVRRIDASDNLKAVGLALEKSGQQRVLVANLTDKPQAIVLRGFEEPFVVEVLGTKKTQASSKPPITLPPYGIARIDRTAD